jgi:integrase
MARVRRNNRYGVKVYVVGEGQRWVGTFDTLREARRAEREAAVEAAKPKPKVGEEKCEEFAVRFLEEHCHGLVRSTIKTYETPVRLFSRDFAGLPLASVNRPMARAWAIKQTRNNVNVIRTLFNHAYRDGLIPANPFANLGLRQSRGRKDLVVLTPEELHALAGCALGVYRDYGPAFRAMILFAAYTGLRPGELFALEWRDLSKNEIHVPQSLSTVGELKRPKNGKVRTVVLPRPAREALADVPRLSEQPWVFTGRTGRRFTRPTLAHTWHPVRALAGRPEMDFYELRHFCATYLLERGLSPSDVAVQLGHTDNGALVMSTYGHPSEDAARRRTRRAFDEAA